MGQIINNLIIMSTTSVSGALTVSGLSGGFVWDVLGEMPQRMFDMIYVCALQQVFSFEFSAGTK